MVWSTLGRLILVPLAFLIAALTATVVLLTLGLERVTRALHGVSIEGGDPVAAVFDLGHQAMLLVSGLTLLPALAIVIIGEIAHIRSLLYYVLGGGVALAAVPLLARIGQTESLVLPTATVWQVFATAGFIGGLVYWLLAGRRA
jgi:hypothetical protein